MISVARIVYQALEGTRIKVISNFTIYINDCIVDCHKRPIQTTRSSVFVTPSIQAKISSNLAKPVRVSIIWLEMPCIQWILNIFLCRRRHIILVIIAQCAVKLLKFNIRTMFLIYCVGIVFTCFSVQLVVRVVVIQRCTDILCVSLLGKCLLFKFNDRFPGRFGLRLARFRIADIRFFTPIASTIPTNVGNVIAGVRIEARLFQISPCQRGRCTAIDFVRRRGFCIGELYVRVAFRDIYIPKVS